MIARASQRRADQQPAFLPANHGFDCFFGLPYSNDMGRQAGTPTDARGEQRGYPPLPLLLGDTVVEEQPDQASLTGRYLDEPIRFIRHSRDQPFFLYLAHMYVHLPITASAERPHHRRARRLDPAAR
jgi:hypothetical protein